eukprot:NODE_652_length_4999_cov_0.731020.p1 type:complete len:466 gc:universal NODE_652_length_4999_cov_0.731020:3913-2516(-)
MNDNCLSFKNSKVCPGYQNFFFDTTISNFYNSSTKDISILDKNIQQFVNVKSIDEIVGEYHCKKEDVSNRQYLRTFICAILVNESNLNCNNPKSPKYLCNTTCNTYINSVKNILDKCSPSSAQLANLTQFCGSDKMFSSDSDCISAEMNEDEMPSDGMPSVASEGWRNEYIAVIVAGIALFALIIIVIFRCRAKRTNPNTKPTARSIRSERTDSPRNFNPSQQSNHESLIDLRNSRSSSTSYTQSGHDSESTRDLNRRTASTNSAASSMLDQEIVSLLAKSTHHYKCVRDYVPTMDDEMEIAVGDIIVVSHQYDDGWAYGFNNNTGQLGVLPLNYIVPTTNKQKFKTRESVYGNKKRLDKINKMRSSFASSMASSAYTGNYSTYTASAYTATTRPPESTYTVSTHQPESIYSTTTYQPPSKKHESEYTVATGFTGYTEDSQFTNNDEVSEVVNEDLHNLTRHRNK